MNIKFSGQNLLINITISMALYVFFNAAGLPQYANPYTAAIAGFVTGFYFPILEFKPQ